MSFYYLLLAILFEVLATSALKLTRGFTEWIPTVYCTVMYMLCHYFFARAIQDLNLGVAYALWCGLGILATVLISLFFFQESLNWTSLVGILLILCGSLLVNLGGS